MFDEATKYCDAWGNIPCYNRTEQGHLDAEEHGNKADGHGTEAENGADEPDA